MGVCTWVPLVQETIHLVHSKPQQREIPRLRHHLDNQPGAGVGRLIRVTRGVQEVRVRDAVRVDGWRRMVVTQRFHAEAVGAEIHVDTLLPVGESGLDTERRNTAVYLSVNKQINNKINNTQILVRQITILIYIYRCASLYIYIYLYIEINRLIQSYKY